MDEKSDWVSKIIGTVVVLCLLGGLAWAIYLPWSDLWQGAKSLFFSLDILWSSLITAVAGIAAAVSAFFSWKALAHARLVKQDDELLAHAILTLERSYAALMTGGSGEAPLKNRFNWLTSARLIVDYKDTKKQIKSAEIIRRCQGHEDHWRNLYMRSLEGISLKIGYYSSGLTDAEKIYPISAVVVHGFSEWPVGRVDNLDGYSDVDDAISDLGLSNRWVGLRSYLGKL